MPSRRRVLGTVGSVGLMSVAGCLGGPGKADRQVSLDASPSPGSWPHREYDAHRTNYNPHATPPRERPTQSWSRVTSSVPAAVVAEGSVFHTDPHYGTVVARRLADGHERWTTSGPAGELAYVDGRLYASTEGVIQAIDPADGSDVWRTEVPDNSRRPRITEAQGVVFASFGDTIAGLHADDGTLLWTLESDHFDQQAVVTRAGLLVARRRELLEFDIDDEGPLGNTRPREGKSISYLPRRNPTLSVVDGRAWVGGYPISNETVFSLVGLPIDRDGTRAVGEYAVDVGVMGLPAGWLVVADPGRDAAQPSRYAAIARDGSRLWTGEFEPYVATAVGGDVVFSAHSGSPTLVAVDAGTGERLWEGDVGGAVRPVGERLVVIRDGQVAVYA